MNYVRYSTSDCKAVLAVWYLQLSSHSRIIRFRVSARKSAILLEAALAFLRLFMQIIGQCFILGHDHLHPQTSQVIINQLTYARQLELLTAAYNKSVMIRIEQWEKKEFAFYKNAYQGEVIFMYEGKRRIFIIDCYIKYNVQCITEKVRRRMRQWTRK